MNVRPTYQRESDLRAENRFFPLIARALNCDRVQKITKPHYPMDAIAFKGSGAVALIETKTRTNPVGAYPDYLLSLQKFYAGIQMADAANIDFVLAVMWADCFGVWEWSNNCLLQRRVALGGRTDRGDKADIEPVVHLPIAQFRLFTTTGFPVFPPQ